MTQLNSLPADASLDTVMALDITVLAGGPGVERDVSLQSGEAVAKALRSLGHRVELFDITPDDLSALDRPADFVFIALHGEFGEDGTLQSELDRRGLPYSGCGAKASRLAMDKVATKRCFEEAGIATPPYFVVQKHCNKAWPIHVKPPAVVKPVASGSSVDTTIAHTMDELKSAVDRCLAGNKAALVETYISGPELTVGILGERALPVCQIRTRREFYNFEAKYVDDDTQYLFELDLPGELLERVTQMSLAAHHALGCQVLSRVDWMVDGETLKPYALEINTIPGFTSHSLVPKAAARIGIDFPTLCETIVALSLADVSERI